MDLSFKRNVGNVDRTIRVILGIVLLYSALSQLLAMSSLWMYLAGTAGVFMLLEGAVGY